MSEEITEPCKNEEESHDKDQQPQQPRDDWSVRFIGYIKRKVDERHSKKQAETSIDRAARVTANATVWIAIFTLVSVSVSLWTTHILKKQLIDFESGATDTHNLAVAASTEAGKMSNVSDAADKIRKAAEDMVTQDQRIADNAQKSLDASNIQSKKAMDSSTRQANAALDASINSSHLDERPWLTVSNFKLSEEPTLNKQFTVTLGIVNTGKTPALNMFTQSRLSLWYSQPPAPTFVEPTTGSKAILAPGIAGISFTTDPLTLTISDQITAYTSKTNNIYVEAVIWYQDTFKKKHWTKVCASHTSGESLDIFHYCEQGNEVDQDDQNPN